MTQKVGLARTVYRKLLYRDLDKIYDELFSQPRKRRNGKKVLDVGCGFGFDLIKKFNDGYDCYGVEIDPYRAKKVEKIFSDHGAKITIKTGTAEKVPFGNSIFDEVICSHVIEHVPNDRKAVSEIYRVMKRGGRLVLNVPHVRNLHTRFRKSIGLKNCYTDRTHVREYTRDQVVSLLKETGFKDIKSNMKGFFPPIGLKVFFLMGHYVPVGRVFEKLGQEFPESAAEIRTISRK